MPMDQVEQRWMVADPDTLVKGRLVQGTSLWDTCDSLEAAVLSQQKHIFSVIIEIVYRQSGNQMFILNQEVVQPT